MKVQNFLPILLVFLLGFSACRKDRFPVKEPTPAELGPPPISSDPVYDRDGEEGSRVFGNLDALPGLRANLLTEIQTAGVLSEVYAGLLSGQVIEVVNGATGGKRYTVFWESSGRSTYKLLIDADAGGNILHMAVLEIRFATSFLNDYYNQSAGMTDFRGELVILPLGDFLNTRSQGIDAQIDDCWKIVFGRERPDGNSGGGGTPPPGSTGRPEPGVIVPDNGLDCEYVFFVVCGCTPHHVGGSGNNPVCHCQRPDIYQLEVICPTPYTETDETAVEFRDGLWDCVDFLNGFGLLTDHELYTRRLTECEGYLDPYDTGPDNPTSVHPDYSFCSNWMPYQENCLAGEGSTYSETMNLWSEFFYHYPNIFEDVIQGDEGCNGPALANLALGLGMTPPEVIGLLGNPDKIPPLFSLLGDPDMEDNLRNNWRAVFDHFQDFYELTFSEAVDLVIDFTEKGIQLTWYSNSGATTSQLNEEFSQLTQAIQTFQQQDPTPRVFFNLYGFNGVTELLEVEGELKWVHHRYEATHGMEVYWIYEPALGGWFPFNPDILQEEQMTFLQALADALLETGHTALDVVGLIPIAGEIADGVNAIWYIAEGDLVNGAISGSSMVPVYGMVPVFAKWSRNSLKLFKFGTESFFVSAKGLKYATATSGLDRLAHLFDHARNIKFYPNGDPKPFHGVFDDKQDLVGVVDEAWEKYLANSPDVLSVTSVPGENTSIVVELNRRIGWQGGFDGGGETVGLTKVKIVIKENTTDELVSAYPF